MVGIVDFARDEGVVDEPFHGSARLAPVGRGGDVQVAIILASSFGLRPWPVDHGRH